MLDIAKNEFLSKIAHDIRTEASLNIAEVLEQVWEQASAQALVDHEERELRNAFDMAVLHTGGPEAVAARIGVSADTIKRWIAHPLDMKLSEVRRFQQASGLSLSFEVYSEPDADD